MICRTTNSLWSTSPATSSRVGNQTRTIPVWRLDSGTGWKINSAELHDTARRIVHLRKLYNIRHGWTPDEDTLPERFLAEPLSEGASAGATLSRPHLQALIGEYNRQRGWSPEGWLSPVLIETVLPPIC